MRWTQLAPAALILAVVGALVVLSSPDHGSSPVAGGGSPSSPAPAPSAPLSPVPSPSRSPSGSPSGPPGALPSTPVAPGPPPGSSPAPQSLEPGAIPTLPGCLVPRQLSVLTFNIHGGRTRHGVDLPAVAAEIRTARADVVLLQEVDEDLERTGFRDEPHVLARLLGMDVYYRSPVRSNAILTRFPVTGWSSTPLPLWPGREQRRLVHAAVLVDGQTVNVFTTHLDQSLGDLRQEQVRAVERLMEPYAGEPTVLGGDLNSVPTSAVLTSLRDRLRDAWAEVGTGPGDTVPARHPGKRIDYVLHNAWLTPRSARVLPSRASDHRSVLVSFDLWGRRGCR